jgi:hypothetical protein
MVIMNAATSVITTRSPYIVRVSHTLPQDTQPMAQWAAKNGIKRVFTLVSDFGPGIDAETTFVKAFKAAGGEIVDSVRSPLSNNDFAPFLQRIKDSRPEAIFVFLPPGSQTIGFDDDRHTAIAENRQVPLLVHTEMQHGERVLDSVQTLGPAQELPRRLQVLVRDMKVAVPQVVADCELMLAHLRQHGSHRVPKSVPAHACDAASPAPGAHDVGIFIG